MNKKDEFLPTRASLLERIRNWDDNTSWQEFLRTYRPLIFSAALKSGLTESEAEDVAQETMVSVAKTIKGFEYDRERCTFKSWLRHLTQKRIADCYRKRGRELTLRNSNTSTGTTAIERVPDPDSVEADAIWEEEWQKQLLATAIEAMKAEVSAEQFQVFDLYVLKKMSVRDVASALGINAAQVYLAKHRVSRLIKKEVARLQTEMG
jgi:RNA polymerase sigma factor (sigma-70 family)